MTIYILSGFNNYYNRIVKKYALIEDYNDFIIYTLQNTNFVPNDNVDTQHTFGSNVQAYNGTGDYVIVADEYNVIISRWFIIDSVRDRAGQYTLTLHRDVIADYYDEVINDGTCFIEKGNPAYGSPFVFNKEACTFNQIKKEEYLLKDNTNSAWLVGYYSKKADPTALKGTVYLNAPTDVNAIAIGSTLENWEYYGDQLVDANSNELVLTIWSGYPNNISSYPTKNTLYYTGTDFQFTSSSHYPASLPNLDGKLEFTMDAGYTRDSVTSAANTFADKFRNSSNLQSYLNSLVVSNLTSYDELNYYNGKTIVTADNKYYKCVLKPLGNERTSYAIENTSNIGLEIQSLLNQTRLIKQKTVSETFSSYVVVGTKYKFDFEDQTDALLKYDMSVSKLDTVDNAYNVFAIPYDAIDMYYHRTNGSTEVIKNSTNIALSTIQSISTNGSDAVYDIQLLPYCPIPNMIADDGTIHLYEEKPLEFSTIRTEDTNNVTTRIYGFIFNVSESKLTFNIPFNRQVDTSPVSLKIANECDFWRLTSPNYSTYFDFSLAMNSGIDYFNVDFELKPFAPYIHINPNFKSLYGSDFNDCRGLICGGEFSLTQIDDHWIDYQLQNKNYENIFKSTIQDLRYRQKYEKVGDITNAITAPLTGGASGALAGSSFGPYGAIAGAAIGGTLSTGGAIADAVINDKLRKQQIKYATEQYNLQLGNIQALPTTISKLTTLTLNNKIFPVLEYYTCTDEEKDCFITSLAYSGMTINAVGTISNYLTDWSLGEVNNKKFIKAHLMRLPEIGEDSHIINEIANELYKGVYIE